MNITLGLPTMVLEEMKMGKVCNRTGRQNKMRVENANVWVFSLVVCFTCYFWFATLLQAARRRSVI